MQKRDENLLLCLIFHRVNPTKQDDEDVPQNILFSLCRPATNPLKVRTAAFTFYLSGSQSF